MLPQDQYMMRGHWVNDDTFLIEWIALPLGNNSSNNIQLKYSGEEVEISVAPPIFAGEPTVIKGSR